MRWLYAIWLMMWLAVLHGQPAHVLQSGREQFGQTQFSGQGNGSKALRPRALIESPDQHVILSDLISKEPLALAVRQGDSQFFAVAKWVYFLILNAEELGVSSANVDQMATSTNPEIRRLLGREGDFGKGLGLDNDWALRVIKAVGNYGEVFDRNVGAGSRIRMDRGLNRLWNAGGLMYAPPIT